jgi:hypothetical protein
VDGNKVSLGREGENERSPFRRGFAKDLEPHHLAQADEGRAAKGKNRGHGIDDEMSVKQRQAVSSDISRAIVSLPAAGAP